MSITRAFKRKRQRLLEEIRYRLTWVGGSLPIGTSLCGGAALFAAAPYEKR